MSLIKKEIDFSYTELKLIFNTVLTNKYLYLCIQIRQYQCHSCTRAVKIVLMSNHADRIS